MLVAVLPCACGLALDWDSRRPSAAARDAGVTLDGAVPRDGSTPDTHKDSGETPPVPTDSGSCPAGMVRAGSYCIDATEVTIAQYADFVATKPNPKNQPASCLPWNTEFAAKGSVPNILGGQQPVVNVDWCDAFAYCAWAGKRLCGRIGGGNANGVSTTGSQWFEACSKSGARTFPYGDMYERNACCTQQSSAADVGSMPSCEGSYPGLFDMSGNVAEWEDACSSNDENAACNVRGGSYNASAGQTECAATEQLPRDKTDDNIGFRCCGP